MLASFQLHLVMELTTSDSDSQGALQMPETKTEAQVPPDFRSLKRKQATSSDWSLSNLKDCDLPPPNC